MGKRFAIVIGVAAAGVMALGAQTAAAGVDRVPPDLQLSGPKRQHPQGAKFCDSRHCDVIVEVSCGDEACTTRAKGRLTKVKNDKLSPDGPNVLAPGKTLKRTGPEMTKETQRKQVRKALRKGEKVKAKVTVRAKDAAGNVATAKRTIRLVRARVDSKVTAAAPEVVKYDTELTITKDRGGNYHGYVKSEVRKCMEGRQVIVFKRRSGTDRKLGADRSKFRHIYGMGEWWLTLDRNYGHRVYAKVKSKVRDRFVCRAERSAFHMNPPNL